MMWLAKSPDEKSVVGHRVLAIHPDALMHAVGELASVGPQVAKLKVSAGEHLAALLLTAVCGPPIDMDTGGEVDLTFDRHAPGSRNWQFGSLDRAAVEVKSFAGNFRKTVSQMHPGGSFKLTIRTVPDILIDAEPQLDRAIEALQRKADDKTSKNIFMIFHPFDAMPIEVIEEIAVIGHVLPRLSPGVDLDTLWVLWHPGILAMWSRDQQRWTDIMFDIDENPPQRTRSPGELDPLQQAESTYLAAINYEGGSPWLFKFSSGDEDATVEVTDS
ncbi:MAG: hypothetical protein ACJ74U_09015 [Jatrophihabitantaceae bacterium]